MIYTALHTLPLGSIRAAGFLREQLEKNRDGMGGHLDEIEPGMIGDPYIHKTYVRQWGEGDQSGWGAEISGNYWTGLVLLAYTLNDPALIAKAENWVNALLQKQRPDGYLGTYCEDDAKIYEDYNAWGTACGMRALLFFYEATGRTDVFDAVYKCMLWFCDKWSGDKKTGYAGNYITVPMMYCYKKTEDRRLLDFCLAYQEYRNGIDLTHTSKRALLEDDLLYNSDHTAGYGTMVYLPALVYAGTGDLTDLEASVRGIRLLREKAMHPTGSPVSVTEYLAPVSSTAETEYCSYAYFNTAYGVMAELTGNACYGDYMEEAVYNGVQGARRKDERAIAYLSAPNQCFATTVSSTGAGVPDMQVYSPCYPVSCCPVNSVVVIPEFIRDMILTDNENHPYIAAYGPCEMKTETCSLTLDTEYPFRNDVTIRVSGTDAVFCKKPCWAKGMRVSCGGKTWEGKADANGYVRVPVSRDGETEITLNFAAEIEVLHIDDSRGACKHPIAFRYGALMFALPIPENWSPFYPKTETPLSEEWPWYNVTPSYEEYPCADAHERTLRRRWQLSWNAAVDERLSPDDIRAEYTNAEGYVWSSPRVVLHVPAYKAPYLYPDYPTRTFEPYEDYQVVGEKMELTLVPYGCTNLRVTYFPRAKVGLE